MKNHLFVVLTLLTLALASNVAFAQKADLKEANEHYEQFAFPKAIELYLKVLEKDRNHPVALERLADCYRLTSNTLKAEFWYKKAVKANPGKPLLKLYYGQTLMSNKKYDQALLAFEEFKKDLPHDKRGYNFTDYCLNINEYMRDSSMFRVNVMPFNTKYSEFAPAYFKDGLVITSGRPDGIIDAKSEWTGESRTDMYFVKEAKPGTWNEVKKIDGKIESRYDEGPASFDARGTTMFFTRNLGKSKAGNGTARLGIFQAKWNGNEWTDIKEMPFNNEKYSVGHPSVNSDGKKLYFTSDMAGGYGGKDIYVSELYNGVWSAPENLGPNVNTEGDEMFPFIHLDGTLYFASNGWGGFGGLDIFSAQPGGEDWFVLNVGYPINSPRDDFGLVLNTSKSEGFISSNRMGGKGGDDIYKISVQPKKAKEMLLNKSLAQAAPEMNLVVPDAKSKETSNNIAALPADQATIKIPLPKVIDLPKPEPVAKTDQAKPIVAQQLDQPRSKILTTPYKNDGNNNAGNALPLVGIVVDSEDKVGLSGAIISLFDITNNTEKRVATDVNGNFYFKLLPDRDYRLVKWFEGKEDDVKTFSTQKSNNKELVHAILVGKKSDAVYRTGEKNTNIAPSLYATSETHEESDNSVADDVEVGKFIATSRNDENNTVIANDAKLKTDLTFKVQIGSFAKAKSTRDAYFNRARTVISTPISLESKENLHRYIVGFYSDYDHAEKIRQQLLALGYADAFVAGYINNYRIEKPIEEVLEQYK